MSRQAEVFERLNDLVGVDGEWPEEPMNVVLEREEFDDSSDSIESNVCMQVNAADGQIKVPIDLLRKFNPVRELLECTAGDEDCPLDLPLVSVRSLKIFIAWNVGELEISAIPWSDFETVVRSCDYLQFDEFFRAMVKIIIPLVHGSWYEIRRRLIFSHETCELVNGYPEYDPVEELENDNFVLDLFPQNIIHEIYFALSKENRNSFVMAFGDSSHRAFLDYVFMRDL